MKRRYPGPTPFCYDEQDLFFGRGEEIKYLSTLIMNNKTTIIHGKSGYGKSSLLNAGIIPHLLTYYNCEIIRVRFYNYDKKNPLTPRNIFLKTLEIQQTSEIPYLDYLLPKDYSSAWRYFKKLQSDGHTKEAEQKMNKREEPLVSGKTYILLFDQFEELFTYHKDQITQFGHEIYNVVQNRIPHEVQEAILTEYNKLERKENEQMLDELAILNQDIPLKIVFSIRSDRFDYLTYLSNYLPNYLNNTYKLRRMGEAQVRAAIIKPAHLENGFESPQFSYHPDLLEKIIDFLSTTKAGSKKIEVFEMQIICSRLEDFIIKSFQNTSKSDIFLTEERVVELGKIKTPSKLFSEIIKNYYTETVNDITDEAEKLAARYLIEYKLIDSITKNRVSLDFVFVHQLGICAKTLMHLVDKKVIRVEINNVSGKSYEISHDSLIMPILDASKELGSLDKQLYAFSQDVLKAYKSKEREDLLIGFKSLLSDEQPQDGLIRLENKSLYNELKKTPLITEVNFSADDESHDNRLILKETFRSPVQKILQEIQGQNLAGLVKRNAATVLISAILIVSLIILVILLNEKANRNQGLVYVGYTFDTFSNKTDALLLTDYIYQKKWNTDEERNKIKNKLAELFISPEIQSRLSSFSDTLSTTNLKRDNLDIAYSGNYIVLNENNPTDTAQDHFEIIDITKKADTSFSGIGYSYFLNQSDTILLAKSSAYKWPSLPSNRFEDTLILYDCRKHQVVRNIKLGKGRFLYSQDFLKSAINGEYDSYRVRFTNSGNLVVPFIERVGNINFIRKVGIWYPNRDSVILSSDMSTSLSKDGKMLMTGNYLKANQPNSAQPFILVYDENGKKLDSIPKVYFADFTPKGSIVYIKSGTLTHRKISNTIHEFEREKTFKIDSSINYAFVDPEESRALVRSHNVTYLLNLTNGSLEFTIPTEHLVGFNLIKNVYYYYNTSNLNSLSDSIPDTLYRKDVNSLQLKYYTENQSFKTFQYNRPKDQVLLLTNNNRLLLLNSDMEISAGFKLTPNDLFGFSGDGNSIYYVLDKYLCTFKNRGDLINLFDLSQSQKWLNNSTAKPIPYNKKIKTLKKKYDIHL